MAFSSSINYRLALLLVLVGFSSIACLKVYAKGADTDAGATASDKVKVGIYFESLCPDSKRFFLKQLVPTFKKIGDIIEPEIIPFGHARVLGNNKMVCQHGNRECDGNRLMACIRHYESNDLKVIETIGCLFEGMVSQKDCITNHLPPSQSYDQLMQCKDSQVSYDLMIEFEKMTGKQGYIPHLTLNGESSENIQNELEQDLMITVCKNYKGVKPAACDSKDEPKDNKQES